MKTTTCALLFLLAIIESVAAHVGSTVYKCDIRYGPPENELYGAKDRINTYHDNKGLIRECLFDFGECVTLKCRRADNTDLKTAEIKSILAENGRGWKQQSSDALAVFWASDRLVAKHDRKNREMWIYLADGPDPKAFEDVKMELARLESVRSKGKPQTHMFVKPVIAPIEFTGCTTGMNSIGEQTITLKYKNTSRKIISAIRIRCHAFNDFGERTNAGLFDSDYLQSQDDIGIGRTGSGKWILGSDKATKYKLTVYEVVFKDGTKWEAKPNRLPDATYGD